MTSDSLMLFVDSHAHLDVEQFENDRDTLIQSFPENNIETVITVADSLTSSKDALLLANKYPYLYATAGVHPHNAASYSEDQEPVLKTLLSENKVVAVGEIGLDYHYEFSKKEVQKDIFAKMLTLAKETDKPVVIHNRKSDDDLVAILKDFLPLKGRGVIHCFDSNIDLAKKVLDMGFYISFSGIVTFKKSLELQDVAKFVPLENMLIETDSPYLAPHPKRGTRNTPLNVRYVAEKIAELKNIPLEQVAKQTKQNTYNLFKIK